MSLRDARRLCPPVAFFPSQSDFNSPMLRTRLRSHFTGVSPQWLPEEPHLVRTKTTCTDVWWVGTGSGGVWNKGSEIRGGEGLLGVKDLRLQRKRRFEFSCRARMDPVVSDGVRVWFALVVDACGRYLCTGKLLPGRTGLSPRQS